jgi:hypothetical protein
MQTNAWRTDLVFARKYCVSLWFPDPITNDGTDLHKAEIAVNALTPVRPDTAKGPENLSASTRLALLSQRNRNGRFFRGAIQFVLIGNCPSGRDR